VTGCARKLEKQGNRRGQPDAASPITRRRIILPREEKTLSSTEFGGDDDLQVSENTIIKLNLTARFAVQQLSQRLPLSTGGVTYQSRFLSAASL
jgi:hypothetical protein